VDARLENKDLFVLMGHGGKDLQKFVQSRKAMQEAKEPRELAEIAVIVYQVLSSIDRLHALGVVHCDITPSNFVAMEGDAHFPQIKLIDFDTAESFGTPKAGRSRATTTAKYISPERILVHQGACLPEADIWALGVMLHQFVYGGFPFDFMDGLVIASASKFQKAFPRPKDHLHWQKELELTAGRVEKGKYVPLLRNLKSKLRSMIWRLLSSERTEKFKGVVLDAGKIAGFAARFAKDAAAESGTSDMNWGVEPGVVQPVQILKEPCLGAIRGENQVWRWLDKKTLQECLDFTPQTI